MSVSRSRTVCLDRPVIRTVELMELPSTMHRTIWVRAVVFSLFMLPLCVSGHAIARTKPVDKKRFFFSNCTTTGKPVRLTGREHTVPDAREQGGGPKSRPLAQDESP